MVLCTMTCMHEEPFGEVGHVARRLLPTQFCFVSPAVKSKLINLGNLVNVFQ